MLESEKYLTCENAAALEKLITQRIDYLEASIVEARRLREKDMEGFPEMYAKKHELEKTAMLIKEVKDKDLKELKDLISLKLSITDYETKHETLVAKALGWEKIEANINGKIWASTWILGSLLVVVNVLYHILFSKS